MKLYLVLFALFAASLAHADCVEVNGKQYCAKDAVPDCKTIGGKEYCEKSSTTEATTAAVQPRVVYVQQPVYAPSPIVYVAPTYYPYYYGPQVVFFRFGGGGHHRR